MKGHIDKRANKFKKVLQISAVTVLKYQVE